MDRSQSKWKPTIPVDASGIDEAAAVEAALPMSAVNPMLEANFGRFVPDGSLHLT
jgi:hypothetical protein